jgi:hypothetical protein
LYGALMNSQLIHNALNSNSTKVKAEAKEYIIRLSDSGFVSRLNESLNFANTYPIQKQEVILMFMRD